MKRDTSIFQMPIFIISLTLLLLNDFWWKQTFHNFLTGKISDFAGLVVFPLFFTAFLPHFKKSIFLSTALIFIFWKSEISELFILFLNQNHIPCSRVVDYSDLTALIVLFFIYDYNKFKVNILASKYTKLTVACLTVFAICATSQSPHPYGFTDNKKGQYRLRKNFVIHKSKAEILENLNKNGTIEQRFGVYALNGFTLEKDTIPKLYFTIDELTVEPPYAQDRNYTISLKKIDLSKPLSENRKILRLDLIRLEESIKIHIFQE